ncbi:ABC transporter substrate-binding protein [Megasphaera sp. UPII 135-E]|uniref:ABC transporter substrate-binding protein n=1 Tax=Megasphaera sp. UPII 135-E TaxID=1000569 RepID=UPI00021A223E|nr:extracellular solute-binding protein [Megasphaera sp. UPII 135-E]EGS33313.1 conserved domain protein [Megasphaera sp. UPII 135-E]MUP47782.1 hypothetical protein [Veillonellaceae bacterium M2-8]MUP59186.1 hypothetical protein [Veillonellaceae bacterium M2-4]
MKRYIPLGTLTVFIIVIFACSYYVFNIREKASQQMQTTAVRHVMVFSDLPSEINQEMATVFYQRTGMRVQIRTVSDSNLKYLMTNVETTEKPDIIIATEPVLRMAGANGRLRSFPVVPKEQVSFRFRDKNRRWLGLWYNPTVFVVRSEYYQNHGGNIQGWEDLIVENKVRIAVPDFAATDMAGDLLCTLVEVNGIQKMKTYLQAIQQNSVSYAKTLSISARRVASGEVDIGVVDGSHARQYQKDGAPMVIVYPKEGTAYWLTGVGVTIWNHDDEFSNRFLEWLFSEDIVQILQKNKIFVDFTTPMIHQEADIQGKSLRVFPVRKEYTEEGRLALQEWWVRTIRFGKDN